MAATTRDCCHMAAANATNATNAAPAAASSPYYPIPVNPPQDTDGNGVLDLDEFVTLVSRSSVLSKAFGCILQTARHRRERTEHERLDTIFRTIPAEASPSGRRHRPSLFDLRVVHDVTLPWERQHAVVHCSALPTSPHKSEMISRATSLVSPG